MLTRSTKHINPIYSFLSRVMCYCRSAEIETSKGVVMITLHRRDGTKWSAIGNNFTDCLRELLEGDSLRGQLHPVLLPEFEQLHAEDAKSFVRIISTISKEDASLHINVKSGHWVAISCLHHEDNWDTEIVQTYEPGLSLGDALLNVA
jgi:hypothetical protein